MADTTKLIEASDFAPYKVIADNITESKTIDPYILEAQQFDLKPLLGQELFIDLLEDFEDTPSLSKYEDLFNGKSYEKYGKKYKHQGLVPVLCYFAYARYLTNANQSSTEYGVVQKRTDESQPVPEATLARMITQAREGAMAYWHDVKTYLDHNANDIPLWNCSKKDWPISGLPSMRGIGDDN